MRLARTMQLCAVLVCALFAHLASAQSYPAKPLRLIVPYPPGGPTDFVGRAVAQKLGETLKQQVIVDNRPGAATLIGTELAAKSAPDGYTLLFGTSAGMVVNPLLVARLPYDPIRDFAPICMLVISPQILVINPAIPAATLKELIALAKSKPGQFNYATPGAGTPNHLGAELLNYMAGIRTVHVPYKGSAPAITDLISGQVQFMFNSMPSVLPHVASGRLRALAISTAQRTPALPDLPTVAEAGVPGFEYSTWYGIYAPAATPAPIRARLASELVRIAGSPELTQRFASEGLVPAAGTPEQLAAYMRTESAKWAKVIKAAGIKLE